MSLAELETAALANNPELRVAARRVVIAETRVGSAGSRSDPEFMYRGWGTPLAKPWDLNQTQHMFMFNQALPGPGKRALRTQLASTEVEQVKAELEAKKRDVTAQVRKRSITFSAIRTNSCCMTSRRLWLVSRRNRRASSMLSGASRSKTC
jgi:outer membrane protein TolC